MSEVREALIVAVDRYDDPKLRRLQAPAEDADALRAVLADAEIGGYEVAFALNQREHELRRTLSRFFSDRRRDDLLLVHFSCHGVKDEDGDLYFAATDTSTDHLHATAIPAELVNRLMDRSASRRIVLMLDCCYGGAFRRGMRSRAGEGIEIKERLNGTGRVVLTASSAMEFAWEGDEVRGGRRPSVFTSAVVDGLRTGKADIDGDQQVSVHELYAYVYERIRAETPQQTPLKFGLEEGPLYIARTRTVQPVPLPDDLEAAMHNRLAAVREGAVHELERLFGERHAGVVLAARQALEHMTEDDSRRVSAAAVAALSGAPPSPVPGTAAPTSHEIPDDSAQRLSSSGQPALPLVSKPAPGRRRTPLIAAMRSDLTWRVPLAAAVPALLSLAPSGLWLGLLSTDGPWFWSKRPDNWIGLYQGRVEFMLGWVATGAVLCGAIAAVLTATRAPRWSTWSAVLVGTALGAVGGVLVGQFNVDPVTGAETAPLAPMYAIFGLVAGLSAAPRWRWRLSIGPVLSGGVAGLAGGALMPEEPGGFVAYAASNAAVAGLIGVAVAVAEALGVARARARAPTRPHRRTT